MKKLGLLVLSVLFFAQGNALANETQFEASNDVAVSDHVRIYTIYVGLGRRARNQCFSYQGRDVVVEGDMKLRVYKAVYWTNGDCDLYY